MAEPARKLVTVDEFLRFAGDGDRRYQLFGGEIVMMAPPARVHSLLAARIARHLGNRLRPPCEAHVEAGIVLPWTNMSFYVADVAVTCVPFGREPWCPEPGLIVEVLSPSTEAEDRGVKLPAYRRLASVQDILLVASDRPAIEHYRRKGDEWTLADLGLGESIRLVALSIEFPLAELYRDLGLEPAAEL
jgi:Uma2 family endonuclease